VVDSFRIHPAIGFARVGNSEDYVISPETMAGSPVAPGSALTGGLPIRAGTESDPVRSSDLRDANGALKRHAARFRIFAYPPSDGPEAYPRGGGKEIVIGSMVNGKTVDGILWTVHVANKKANQFILSEGGRDEGTAGIGGYENGNLPPIRNVGFPTYPPDGANQPPVNQRIATLASLERTARLIIDPGPRTIGGASAGPVRFNQPTMATYSDGSPFVEQIPDYPKSFPATSFPGELEEPSGPIDTLGELITDAKGRLLVLGGFGRAVTWLVGGQPGGVGSDVNNDQWLDDTSDGPVSALIFFNDGSTAPVAGAWVTTTDPSFAPQIRNIVTLWEDIYDSWVRSPVLNLAPQIYDVGNGAFVTTYKPIFDQQVAPIFQSAALQQWAINLSSLGASSHAAIGAVQAPTDPYGSEIFPILRDGNDPSQQTSSYMPLHLGDAGHSFLSLRDTQYFFVEQWSNGTYVASGGPSPGPGEYLDMAVLANCLGGRFSPGIDMTFVMREPSIYIQSWQSSGSGPFRVNPKNLGYGQVMPNVPVLGVGYVPRQNAVDFLEPGDLSKFLALPWHTDYNSCATHAPGQSNQLFWSWPAQRPVAVYTAAAAMNQVGPLEPVPPAAMEQQWSVRGPGTESDEGQNWGRYQDAMGMVTNWHMIGTIIQAPQIDFPPNVEPIDPQPAVPANWYLEVESQLPAEGQKVWPFPNYVGVPGH